MKLNTLIFLTACSALIAGCSDQPEPIDIAKKSIPSRPLLDCIASEYLLPKFDSSGASRIGEVAEILPDSLAARIGESSNRYLYYHFVGLADAKYRIGQDTVDLEIAQFETIEDAFGFGVSLRPAGTASLEFGMDAFIAGQSLYLIAAEYVATLSLLSDNKDGVVGAEPLARDLAGLIEMKPAPRQYMFFPYRDQISASARYYTYDYLNVYGLNNVYTVDYTAKGDTVTLFMITDTTGAKFQRLKMLAESTGRVINQPKRMKFDKGLGIAFEHPQLGVIVAGVKQNKIIGVIGYDPRQMESLVTGWIKGLE